jgi:hypothetical protein
MFEEVEQQENNQIHPAIIRLLIILNSCFCLGLNSNRIKAILQILQRSMKNKNKNKIDVITL